MEGCSLYRAARDRSVRIVEAGSGCGVRAETRETESAVMKGTAVTDTSKYVTLEEAAALEGLSYQALSKSLRRRDVILRDDPEDRRRKQVPLTALTPRAYSNYLKGFVS